MATWKPSLITGVDLRKLPLTAEEGFVASRLDGTTDLRGLIALTGYGPEKIDAALERLVSFGAITPAERTPAPPVRLSVENTPPPIAPLGLEFTPVPAALRTPRPKPLTATPAPMELSVAGDGTQEDSHSTVDESADDTRREEDEEPDQSGTHRALFEGALHALPGEERALRALKASEPELSALCYDPLPGVVHALLDNPRFGPVHARLVARHHGTAAGLEALGAKAAFTADIGVRRALVRNPQLPAGLFRRLYSSRRLLEQFQLTVSRDLPEQTRRTSREVMRARFANTVAEERVELIMRTEGRALAPLSGMPVDGKTAAMLCGRTYASTILVQNIARWSAAPPPLIQHLLRQDVVRRSPLLRTLLQRHPNAPAEAKR
ncbi:MAG: hypothetical protein ACT4TC_12795 [Myxococcaceae bacterium]